MTGTASWTLGDGHVDLSRAEDAVHLALLPAGAPLLLLSAWQVSMSAALPSSDLQFEPTGPTHKEADVKSRPDCSQNTVGRLAPQRSLAS